MLGGEAFVLRFFGPDGAAVEFGDELSGDRLLLVNLGRDLRLDSAAEPLLAPPATARWRQLWSSEHASYGGGGTPPVEDRDGIWRLPGRAAIVMTPVFEPGSDNEMPDA